MMKGRRDEEKRFSAMKKACVVPDDRWPNMFRVQWPDGTLSDMANLSRTDDAAARFNETQGREQRGRQRGEEPGRSRSPAPGAVRQLGMQITSPSSLAA
jgi:hypothetical protein